MAKQQITPTPDDIRAAYLEQLSIRNPKAEEFVLFAEQELADFIRRYDDSNFRSIFEKNDHNYYDRLRSIIATNREMKEEDDSHDFIYSIHLRTYSNFLGSKAFKSLFKAKRNTNASMSGSSASSTEPAEPVLPKEREATEGEKKHVEYERAHRSQALRQACINKYGYQCQCCGMNFTELYGEELGANFIEVHHLKMIATYDESKPKDYIDNLVPLCSNCHSMIHHVKATSMTLTAVRDAFKGDKEKIKKKIKVWKEDSAVLYDQE